MIKIVFFDIDGTLLPYGHKDLLDSTKEALKKLKARGVKIAISSGRQKNQIQDEIKNQDFDAYVSINGMLCSVGDQVIHRRPLEEEDRSYIVDLMNKKDISAFIVEEDRIYMNYMNEQFIKNMKRYKLPQPSLIDPIDLDQVGDIYQVVVFAEEENRYEEITRASQAMKIVNKMPDGVDMAHRAGGKDEGIKAVLDYYGYDEDQALVIGDGYNDISMLGAFKNSIAMGNASDQVKKHASYVTTRDVDHGIYKGLEYFNLI